MIRDQFRGADNILAGSFQALLQADLGQLRCDYHAVWLCFLPFRLARSREGNSSGYHSLQPGSLERQTIPECFPAAGNSWACQLVSSSVYLNGVSSQNSVHNPVAERLLVDI